MAEKIFVLLVNLSWQLALISVLAWLIITVFRIRSALTRYVIWLAVVLCPVVLVPMNIISSDIVLFHAPGFDRRAYIDYRSDLTGTDMDYAEHLSTAVAKTEGSFHNTESTDKIMEKMLLEKPFPLGPEHQIPIHYRSSESILKKLMTPFVFIWIFGSGAGLVLISIGFFRLRRLISNGFPVVDESVLSLFRQVKGEIATSRNIRLIASDKARMPFSIGFINPCVILPGQMLDQGARLRMVLAHEIVHLKRFDDLINLICRVIGSFMFFHPLFHLAFKELQLSSEQICDGYAIRLTGERENYANCLVELSRASLGKLPIGFGKKGSSMAKRVKSIFRDEEVFKMMSRKSILFLSVSIFVLILMVSTLRLVSSASAGQTGSISGNDRFQRCENRYGAGFYWVDTATGGIKWADPGKGDWKDTGQPETAKPGETGTYVPCPNGHGPGLFVMNTITSETWWARGYEPEWKELGKPEETAGELGTFMPCENVSDPGLFVVKTTDGSTWWNLPEREQGWKSMGDPGMEAGAVGMYMPYRNSKGKGLFILNTTTGACWWTDGDTWDRINEGSSEAEAIGTYTPYNNKDGPGILIMSAETGKGWWAIGGDVHEYPKIRSELLQGKDEVIELLRQEMEKAKKELYAAEEALTMAQERGFADFSNIESDIMLKALAELRTKLIDLDLTQQEAEGELQSITGDYIPENDLMDPELTSLRDRLGALRELYDDLSLRQSDDHPELGKLQDKISLTQEQLEQTKFIVGQKHIELSKRRLENEVKKLELKKLLLRNKIEEYNQRLRKLPRRQMELNRLQRDKEAAEKTYEILLQKLNEVEFLGKPYRTAKADVGEEGQLILEIRKPKPGTSSGTMTLNGQITSMETLFDDLQKRNPDREWMLIIKSDRDVTHNQITEAMDIAKRSNIGKIGFALLIDK